VYNQCLCLWYKSQEALQIPNINMQGCLPSSLVWEEGRSVLGGSVWDHDLKAFSVIFFGTLA
jgi:hypothetical protein